MWGNDIPLPILVVKSSGNTKETQVAPRRFSAGGEVARFWGGEGGFRPSRAPRSAPCAPEKSIQTRPEQQRGSNLQNALRDQRALLQHRDGRIPKHTTCQAGASSITPPLPLCPLRQLHLLPRQVSKSRVNTCICQPHKPGVRVSCCEIPVPALPRAPSTAARSRAKPGHGAY